MLASTAVLYNPDTNTCFLATKDVVNLSKELIKGDKGDIEYFDGEKIKGVYFLYAYGTWDIYYASLHQDLENIKNLSSEINEKCLERIKNIMEKEPQFKTAKWGKEYDNNLIQANVE